MQHSFIVPTKYILDPEIGLKSDFILALSHLIDDDLTNEYAQSLLKRKELTGKPIILDNGLYENHKPESWRSLWMKAINLWAISVFAPDHLYGCEKTREALFEFMDIGVELEKELNITLPGVNYVIQAHTPEEYIEEFIRAQDYPIEMIWLSILSIPKCFEKITNTRWISLNRAIALWILDKCCVVKKKAHLLGLGESCADIYVARQLEWCVSNDSCLGFRCPPNVRSHSERGVVYFGKPEKKLDFNYTIPERLESSVMSPGNTHLSDRRFDIIRNMERLYAIMHDIKSPQ